MYSASQRSLIAKLLLEYLKLMGGIEVPLRGQQPVLTRELKEPKEEKEPE